MSTNYYLFQFNSGRFLNSYKLEDDRGISNELEMETAIRNIQMYNFSKPIPIEELEDEYPELNIHDDFFEHYQVMEIIEWMPNEYQHHKNNRPKTILSIFVRTIERKKPSIDHRTLNETD